MKEPATYLFSKMWSYSQKSHVIAYTILMFFANMVYFAEPLIIAEIFNTIQETGLTQINYLLGLLVLFLVASAMFWAFHIPARLLETKNAFFVRAKYKQYLLEGTLDLPSKWHSENHSGDTIDKIEKGTTSLFEFSSTTFLVIETVIRLLTALAALIYFSKYAGIVSVFLVILTFFIILLFDKRIVPKYEQIYKLENGISAKIFDTISNVTTIIILRVERLVTSALYKKITEPFTLFFATTKLSEIKWFVVSMCAALMMIIVIGLHLLIALKTNSIILIGTLYLLYEYVSRITNIYYRFAYHYGDIVRQRTQVDNAELLAKEFKQRRSHESVLGKWKTVEIKNLDFSYEGNTKQLSDVSLCITKGERIALIGESGSGKTTFLKILRELYPATVNIYVDGERIEGLHKISEDITLIPQEPEIFNTSIKENITIGTPHSIKELQTYTDMARITTVIEKLPNKWESQIQEKGVNLSGGQKQRLALARGLLASKEKQILLLDESTSSVDSVNEGIIYDNVFKHFKGTIVASIHKMHLLPKFDMIYWFADGKIIAQGSFKELLKNKQFKKQWDEYTKEHKE